MMKTFGFGHATHTGHVRSQNQDSYDYNASIGLWLLADGMGGHAAGDIASQVAVKHIIKSCENGIDICTATTSAHQAVIAAAEEGQGHPDMGTTAVTLQIKSNRYEVAWIGDSRAYLWDGQRLVQITKDHSIVQELIDSGQLRKEGAKKSPYANVLSRTIGVSKSTIVNADLVTGEFSRGQQILLCTDGLTNEIEDKDITKILSSSGNPQEQVDRLINMALSHGGSDNITAILVKHD
ncbi:MAG: protein phosphatase 2C domain-containing protein [Gammaproteobacteria bacterium]